MSRNFSVASKTTLAMHLQQLIMNKICKRFNDETFNEIVLIYFLTFIFFQKKAEEERRRDNQIMHHTSPNILL